MYTARLANVKFGQTTGLRLHLSHETLLVVTGVPEYLEKTRKAALNLKAHQISEFSANTDTYSMATLNDFQSNRPEITV